MVARQPRWPGRRAFLAGARAAAAAGLDAKAEVSEVTYEGITRAILAAAERHDASLVVLGACGLSAFKSVLLGSVSHSVAQHAHRAVLVVPPALEDHKAAESVERVAATV